MSDANAKRAEGPRTLVEEGTQFKGSLSSKCPIEVKGRVEGDLQAPSLTVSSKGAVHGKVKVEELLSEGEIAGEFDADVVRLSGVVKDNTVIRAKSLEVKLTPANGGRMQLIFGECALEVGDAPTKEASVSKATPATGDASRADKSAPDKAPAAEAKGEKTDKGDKTDKSEKKDKVERASMPPPSAANGGL
jgi:cytoskeletal protein CcmA (bactofilin family)